jgi:hypothetical protein
MDGGDCHGGCLDFAVGGKELVDGTKAPAAELARYLVGAGEVGIDDADQSYGFSLLL